MEKHIADNLTYFGVQNDLMTQRIYEAARNTAEQKVLEKAGDQESYDNEYEIWRKIHAADIEEAVNDIDVSAIAQIRAKSMKNVVTNADSSFIIDGVRKEREPLYKDMDTEELVGAIGLENLENIARVEQPAEQGASSTTSEAAEPIVDPSNSGPIEPVADASNTETVETNTSAPGESVDSSAEAAKLDDIAKRKERLQKQGVDVKINAEKIGKFMSFDLRNNVATEFAFSQRRYDTGAYINNGRFGSIVGFTEEQRDYSLQLIDKAGRGEELTKEESSWIDHLALAGKNRANETAPGVFWHPEFNREISSYSRLIFAEAGAKDCFRIGEKQRELGPTTEYAGKKMYAWEAEFFGGIDSLADGETVIVYGEGNSSVEDINKLIENGLWSEGAKEYVKEQQVTPKEIMGVAFSKDKDFVSRSPGENADLVAKAFTSPEERLTDEQRAEYKELFESESSTTEAPNESTDPTVETSSESTADSPSNETVEPAEPTVESSNEPAANASNGPRTSTVTTPNGDIIKTETELNYQRTNWKVSQSDADMVAGVQNAIDKGEFVAWDTETLGGQDEFGRQRYDAVTEFTFKRKKYNAEAETIESFGSAVGITDEQYAFGEHVWKKVGAGAKLTGQEEVWAHRLALIGESKYEQAKDKGKGVFEYTHFADKDEILKLDPDEIKAGLEKAYTMGKEQRSFGANVKYAGEKMYAWESELFQGIDTIINKDLTAVGHNTVNFDRKALQWLLQHGMWSEGAKKIAAQRLERLTAKNGDLHFDHEFDTMAAQNQHQSSRLDNFITTDDKGNAVVNEEALLYAKKRKLTLGQQEAIGNALYPDIYNSADVNAHTSDVDVDVVGKMFTSEKYGLGENSFLKDAKNTKAYKIKGDSSQLFHMTRSHTTKSLSENGILGFVTGEIRDSITTFSGVEHTSEGARKLIFHPGALQKGVSYSISNVTALSVSEELQKHIAKAQPNADMENLIAVTFTPEFHKGVDPGYTANRSVTLVGSRFDIESLLNQSALLYATKDKDGKYVFTDDKDVQKALAIREIDENGRTVGARSATVEDMLIESSEKLHDSGALRANREHSLKKDMGLLQYIGDMRAWGTENGTDDLENRFMEEVASGNTKRSFADYFGYKDFESGKQIVENTTMATAMSRVDYVVRNEKTIRDAAQRALDSAGTNKTVDDVLDSDIYLGVDKKAKYYYKRYMDAVTDAAMYETFVGGKKSNVGLINDGAHVYELNNVEIDMRGFNGRYDFTEPFRIDLNAGGKTNFRNLVRFLGDNPDMGQDRAVALLEDFQEFLIKSKSLETFGPDAIKQIKEEQGRKGAFKINGNNNIDAAFAKITHSLNAAKEKYPAGGLLTPTERYTLIDHMDEFGLGDEARKIILDRAVETTPRPLEASSASSKLFAREATNKILYGGLTDIDEVKKKFMDFGYSEHDALKAAYIRNQQRLDTQKALEKITEAVRKYGGNMGMDIESGEIFVDANGKRTVLDRMLKNVIENGMSFIESGNMRFFAPVGLYATNLYRYKNGIDNKLNYKFTSKIGAEFENMGWLYSSLERSSRQGRLGEGVQSFIGSLANAVGKSASVLAEDFQEMRMGGDVDLGGILPLIARDDVWNNVSSKLNYDDPYTGEANRVLRAAVEKIQSDYGKEIKYRHLPDSYKNFSTNVGIAAALRDILPELHNYLDSDSQEIMRRVLGSNYQDFDLGPKAAGKGMVNAYRDMQPFGGHMTSVKRGAPDFTSRSEKFYTNGKALDGAVEGVSFGRAINTAAGHAYEEDAGIGVATGVNDVVRTGRIRMATGTIKQLADNANLTEQARNALLGIHLTEGAGVMDPRLVDAFFTHNKAVQRINQGKVLDIINDQLDHIDEKSKMAAKIHVNSDGTISFRYSNGLHVETEELEGKSPLTVKGMGKTGNPAEIKEEGVMRLGFFSHKNNLLVSEEDVQKVLNQEENSKRIFEASDRLAEAYTVLMENFDAAYYNMGVDAKTHIKMEEYWEKGMLDSPFGYLGKGGRTAAEINEDKQMAKALEKLGVQELMEFIPHKDLIESLKSDNIANTMFGAYLEGKTGHAWLHSDIVKTIAEGMRDAGANVTDAEAGKKLFDIAVRERYSVWDEITGLVKDVTGYTDEQMRKMHSITNFYDVAKHVEMPINLATNLLAQGKTEEEVISIMGKAVPGLQIQNGKDGSKVIIGEPEKVNVTELQRIAEDLISKGVKLEDESVFWTGNGKHYTQEQYDSLSEAEKQGLKRNRVFYSFTENARGSDYDRERFKLWKYDYRSKTMSDVDRYSNEHLSNIKTELLKAFEDKKDEGQEIIDRYFADSKAKIGERTGEGFFQDLERSRWYTPGTGKDNMRVLIHGDVDQSLLTKEEKDEIEKAYRRLEKAGIDRDFTNAVVETAKAGYKNNGVHVEGSNADYISVDKVKARYSFNQHLLADQFNKRAMTMDQVVEKGFGKGQIINLQDLFTAESNFEKVADHLYGKSAFIDLQMNGGKGAQIYEDESERFIAIPWTDQNLFSKDGEVIKNQYQSIAFKMHNTMQKLQAGVDEDGKPLGAEQKQAYLNTLSGYTQELKDAVRYTALDKDGILHRKISTSELDMSYFGKASGHEILGETDGFWGNITFDGHKVQDMYQKKVIIDYQAASLKVRNRFYNDEYFKQLGFSGKELESFKEGVFERLKTSGTLSTNSRNPQGYDKSTSAAVMYFSGAITGDNLKVSEAMWESKKGDYDSDEGIAHVLSGDAVINKKGEKPIVAKIDYATYEQLQKMAETGVGGIESVILSSHTERSFRDAKAQIWGQAVTRNRLAYENVMKHSGETEVGSEYKYDKYIGKEAIEGAGEYYDGPKHFIDSAAFRNLGSGERTVMRSQYAGFMEKAKAWKGINDEKFDNMSEEAQRNLYTGYVHSKVGMDTDAGNTAMDALSFVFTERRELQNKVARERNAAAGQMNNAVFRLLQVADASGQFDKDDSIRAIAAIHTALNEAFLSPKNEKGLTGITDIEELRDAANEVYRLLGQTRPNKQAVKDADERLANLARKALVSRDFRELRRYVPGFDDAMGEKGKGGYTEEQEKYAKEYVDKTFGSIGQRINAAGFDFNAFDIGMKDNKDYSSSMQYAYGGMANSSMIDMDMQAANSIAKRYKNATLLKENAHMGEGDKSYQKTIEAGDNFAQNMKEYENAFKEAGGTNSLRDSSHTPPPALGDMGRGATRALSNIKISGGGALKTMAVVAGGLMASGYVGGVKTTSPQSATTQAAGANEALQEQQVPQLSDSNVNVLRGGPQSGYVINISASSPQGSDAARDAITQALGSSVPVNTSMNINMSTNYQDQVNQLQISRMLENII